MTPPPALSSNSRSARILKAVFSAGAARLLTSGVSLLTLPLAVPYLGAERFGVWATITTTAVWINLLDLGVAGTLTNHISRAYALDDRQAARRYFTNALLLTAFVSGVAALAFLGLLRWVNWASLFHVSSRISPVEIRHTVGVAGMLMLLGLPCNLGIKLLAGYQELPRANYAAMAGAAASLAGLALGVAAHASMPVLYLMSLGCLTLTNLVLLLGVLGQKPWLLPRLSAFDLRCVRQLLDSGSSFFLIQVAAVVVFSSDNLIVSHYLGAAEVTPYSVTWRFAGCAALLQSLLFPVLWPAYAEAYARHDHRWIRRTFSASLKGIVALNVFCAAGLLTLGPIAIQMWAGAAAVPGKNLLLMMSLWMVVNGFMSVESCLLAALNRVRGQAVLSIMAAVVNVALSLLLVRRIGAVGVIGGTVISYLLVLIVPQSLIVRSVWRKELQEENALPFAAGRSPAVIEDESELDVRTASPLGS
jgi:O-antigen/teichoic acid export membrane protein